VIKEASLIFDYEENDDLHSQMLVKAPFQNLSIAKLARLIPEGIKSWSISMLIEDELHDTDCYATRGSHAAGPKPVLQS